MSLDTKLSQFRELFNPLPGNRYLEATTTPDAITELFGEMMHQVGGELHLALYGTPNEEELAGINAKVERGLGFASPFRAAPRDHDTVLLKDIFAAHQNKPMILKLSYTTLANTANIIIMEKKGMIDTLEVMQMLEEHEFRSPNTIEIVEGYDLIVAKKMHMWGNGL
ncbi:MAG: hypothetical protein PHX44_07495 [Sulfurimonas sp.]|uniref:hypothetical protein n=1 Tax=Sulfurimonas sp. TaxID=2022749 RepID=UPI00261725DB|nr:hypothetical protein [Sulfurimonas sp.]MDD2652878.1 hypothetical protein [Sulfurimonas sp.]MDD3452324.1 hypothetical protein [Sulfurimonas sp.]